MLLVMVQGQSLLSQRCWSSSLSCGRKTAVPPPPSTCSLPHLQSLLCWRPATQRYEWYRCINDHNMTVKLNIYQTCYTCPWIDPKKTLDWGVQHTSFYFFNFFFPFQFQCVKNLQDWTVSAKWNSSVDVSWKFLYYKLFKPTRLNTYSMFILDGDFIYLFPSWILLLWLIFTASPVDFNTPPAFQSVCFLE